MAKRKRVLIDSAVQWAIGRRVIMHWMVFLTGLLSLNAFLHTIGSISEQTLWQAVVDGLRAQVPILGVMLVLLPVFVYDTIKLSNRFAGPMYRLRTSITALGRGKTTRPIAFRDGDFWQDAAEEFNQLRERVQFLEQRNQELSRTVQRAAETETANV
ncbi:hypothetical protein [Roseimaritima ulvae]|uniref:HAMP domain-containing protein n=1 Tax=Roseimaritima ulvae TaxID=980254 RepID=A0A5B9QR82_9BACT|nr:hypothetical protein [Roseimaritima ulvae]QEG41617.1 hypothetical protein UC8_36430 [Roseimaritima ulvae]